MLDDPISSKTSKSGQIVRAHLKEPIVVAGRTVAPAGTPAQIKILDVSAADIADQYGFVDIFFEAADACRTGASLPLRTPIARLTPNVTSGHESTVEAEDTVGDIFVPYYSLWQIVRHGKELRARRRLRDAREHRSYDCRTARRRDLDRRRRTRRAQSMESPNASFPGFAARNAIRPLGATPRPRTTPAPTATPSTTPAPSTIPSPSVTPRCFKATLPKSHSIRK